MSIWGAGFRPFFLAAGLWLTFSTMWWGGVLAGHLPLPGDTLIGVAWHAHELLFGYAGAVLFGFFLTAPAVWTQTPPPRGGVLALLVGLWVVARLSNALGGSIGFWVDTLLPIGIAADVARRVVLARRWQNLPFVGLLGLFGLSAGAHHLQWLSTRDAAIIGLDALILVLLLFGGRIVPMFTRNAVPQSQATTHAVADAVALSAAAWMVVLDMAAVRSPMFGAPAAIAAVVAGLAGAYRHRSWGFSYTLSLPLLWVLHVGMFWLYLGLVVRGVCGLWWPEAFGAATHLLTIGGLGSLTIGMMSRVALGHTGRSLRAPWPMRWGFAAISVAAVVRVVSVRPDVWVVAAALLAAASALFTMLYAPILFAERVDGRPG